MAITSIGYDGSIDESAWAKLAPRVFARYWVNEGSWIPTAKAGASWTINLSAGTGGGDGVLDISDDIVEVALPSPTGSPWHVIYMQRDWDGVGGTSEFDSMPATSDGNIPVDLLNGQAPGSLTKQPIALVQLVEGQTQPAQIIDLRVWAANGGLTARSDKVTQYLYELGTQITVGSTVWSRVLVLGSPSWKASILYPRLTQRRWTAGRGRTNSYDTYGSGFWAPLIRLDLPADAPAGEYQACFQHVGGSFAAGAAIPHDILIAGPSGSRIIPAHYDGVITGTYMGSVPFTHTGGSATFLMSGKAGGAADIAMVFNFNTYLDVYYIGPTA